MCPKVAREILYDLPFQAVAICSQVGDKQFLLGPKGPPSQRSGGVRRKALNPAGDADRYCCCFYQGPELSAVTSLTEAC